MPLSLRNAHLHAGVEVTSAIAVNSTGFWDVSPCHLGDTCPHLREMRYLQNTFLQNSSKYHTTRRRCGVHKFSKTCRSHAIKVTWSKFHSECPQTFGAWQKIQSPGQSGACDLWTTGPDKNFGQQARYPETFLGVTQSLQEILLRLKFEHRRLLPSTLHSVLINHPYRWWDITWVFGSILK